MQEKLKIALLTPTFNSYSGIDRVVEQQAERYINDGYDVTIFALEAKMKPKRAELVVIGISKNLLIQRLERLFYFLFFWKVRKYGNMLECNHDYERIYSGYWKVISHFYPMNWIAIHAQKKYGTQYIYWDYGIAKPETFSSIIERIYMKLFNIFNNYTIKKANKVISISKYLSKELYQELSIESEVKYPIVNTKRFYKDSTPKARDPLCLYVGRISPHKGIHLLLEAFELVLKEIPTARLIIAGKRTFEKYYDQLAYQAHKIDLIRILFIEDATDEELVKLYRTAHVYTTATQWEGYDLPIKEAELCGTPSVAFDIGPHKEVLKKGILVQNGDIEAFAEAVIKVLRGEEHG